MSLLNVFLGLGVAGIASAFLPRRVSAAIATLALGLAILVIAVARPAGVLSIGGLELFEAKPVYNAMAVILLVGELLVLLSTLDKLDNYSAPLVLMAVLGGLLILYSKSFITLIAGMETSAAALAGLALRRSDDASREACLKYVFSSLFAASLVVMGVALLAHDGIMVFARPTSASGATVLGIALVFAGLALEVGLAPFYLWLPDFVEGGDWLAVVTSLLAVDGFLLFTFFKLVDLLAPVIGFEMGVVLGLLSISSMIIGEFGALAQKNLRRMIGYSMVSDAGYAILLALAYALHGGGNLAVPAYFIVASNLSIALIVASTVHRHRDAVSVSEAIGILSLAGVPPFLGFPAKLLVIVAFASIGFWWIALIAAVFFLVSAAYLFRRLMQASYKVFGGSELVLLAYGALLLILGLCPDLPLAIAGGGIGW